MERLELTNNGYIMCEGRLDSYDYDYSNFHHIVT